MPFASAEVGDVEEVEDMQEAAGEARSGAGQTATAVNGARGGGGTEVDGAPKVDGRGGSVRARAACQARRKLAASGRR
jgi:hypothetical protein